MTNTILVAGQHNHFTTAQVKVKEINSDIKEITSEAGFDVDHAEHRSFSINSTKVKMGNILEASPFEKATRRLAD